MISSTTEKQLMDAIYNATSIDDLNTHFKNLCQNFHIEKFALAKISTDITLSLSQTKNFEIFDTYPVEWMDFYIKKKLYILDPVYRLIEKTYLPQSWHINNFNNISEEQRKIFEMASDFNICSGTTIPIKRNDNSLIYFTSTDRIIHHPEVLYLFSYALTIYWDIFQKQIENLKFAQLTEKEKEVLFLKKKGLLSKNIASDLNISMATVAFHLKNIRQKLKCSRTEQAIYNCSKSF